VRSCSSSTDPSGRAASTAGRDGEPWLAESDFRCPDGPVDAATLAERQEGRPFVNLACQGGRDVTFKATMGGWEAQCGVDPCCTIEPCWLGDAFEDGWVAPPGSDPSYEAMVPFRFDPGIDQDALPRYTFLKRLPVRITGRFDHPASARCRPAAGVPDPIPTPVAILYCRTKFVVTGIRVLVR
jgi:hypothetical protein